MVVATVISGADTATTRPVATIVLKERFARPDLGAVVLRTAAPNTVNVIALKRSAATPELLGTALATLARSRESAGDAPPRKITVVIRDGLKHRPLSATERTRLSDTIARLFAARAQPVSGVGNVPAITLDLSH